MKILVNGQKEEIQPGTVASFVQEKGLQSDSLIIELNRKIIKQAQWHETELQENDELELLSFVGGG